LGGYCDASYAMKQQARPPNESRARSRLAKILQQRFDSTVLEELVEAGGRLSEAEACLPVLDS
jgi:hypothetical protein